MAKRCDLDVPMWCVTMSQINFNIFRGPWRGHGHTISKEQAENLIIQKCNHRMICSYMMPIHFRNKDHTKNNTCNPSHKNTRTGKWLFIYTDRVLLSALARYSFKNLNYLIKTFMQMHSVIVEQCMANVHICTYIFLVLVGWMGQRSCSWIIYREREPNIWNGCALRAGIYRFCEIC